MDQAVPFCRNNQTSTVPSSHISFSLMILLGLSQLSILDRLVHDYIGLSLQNFPICRTRIFMRHSWLRSIAFRGMALGMTLTQSLHRETSA